MRRDQHARGLARLLEHAHLLLQLLGEARAPAPRPARASARPRPGGRRGRQLRQAASRSARARRASAGSAVEERLLGGGVVQRVEARLRHERRSGAAHLGVRPPRRVPSARSRATRSRTSARALADLGHHARAAARAPRAAAARPRSRAKRPRRAASTTRATGHARAPARRRAGGRAGARRSPRPRRAPPRSRAAPASAPERLELAVDEVHRRAARAGNGGRHRLLVEPGPEVARDAAAACRRHARERRRAEDARPPARRARPPGSARRPSRPSRRAP